MEERGLNSSGAGQVPQTGSCEHGNEPSGFIICCGLLVELNNYQLLQKDSAPRGDV
jgi:hypothetical protein